MGFGRTKNRRKVDAATRAAVVRSVGLRLGAAAARILGACALAAALFFGGRAAYDWALTSPTFGLKNLSFHGLHRAGEGDLCKLAGIAPGMNLFLLDPDALQRAIAGHPWVRSVELRRQFPSTLVVAVTEHEAVAMASLGDLYLLDKEGEPFKRVQAGDAVDLPVVTGVERDDYVASPRHAAERFRGALEWLAAYDASDRPIGARLSEVKVEPLGFTLVTSSGVEIHVGDRPPAEELARLSRVAAELSRRGLTAQVVRLDNRVRPGWVAVKTGR